MAAADYTFSPIEIARFWSRVSVTRDGDCWLWKGTLNADGYGTLGSERAHRIAYTIFFGSPGGDALRHTCDTPECCNPLHLLPGSHAENVADRVARDRSAAGAKNGRAKLTEDQVVAIFLSNETSGALAKQYSIDRNCIIQIRNRTTWKKVTAGLERPA